MNAASTAGGRLAALAGGPLGIGLIAAGIGYTLVSQGADRFRDSAREAAVALLEQDDALRAGDQNVQDRARRLADEAGLWEGLAASRRGATQALEEEGGVAAFADDATGGLISSVVSLADQLTGGELAAAGYADEIEAAAEELGAFGAQQETAQTTSKRLNELIAEGTTSGEEFAEAVRAAAEAEADQARTTDLAKAAMDAYNATTRDAVQTQLDLLNAQLQQRDGLIGLQQTVHEARDVVDDLSTPWNEVEEATNRVIGAALSYGTTAADAAVSAARANGTVLDSLSEAKIRADATIGALRESLNAPGLTDEARSQIQGMIDALVQAQESGDVQAILSLTGVEETESDLASATEDRDTIVRVETRNGPAVVSYLERITEQRLSIIRVESRNGPAVNTYLDGLASEERLAIVRVESRNGPAVDEYLDRLASQSRTAYIDVRERPGASIRDGVGAMRGAPGAALVGAAGGYGSGSVTIESMTVVAQTDTGGRLTSTGLQNAGREYVAAIQAYERRNGARWRR
jgi:hypothetical protein